MIHLSVRKVNTQHLGLLREWLAELNGPRRQEGLVTLNDEGCSHELAVIATCPQPARGSLQVLSAPRLGNLIR